MSRPQIELWTDGSTYPGNPGRGGWGLVLVCKERMRVVSGSTDKATNNEMETQAVIEGLSLLTKPCKVVLYTDSVYVINGINAARYDRILKTNIPLWEQMAQILKYQYVQLRKVKGHSGEVLNELANDIAREAAVNRIGVDNYIAEIPEYYIKKSERKRRAREKAEAKRLERIGAVAL